MTELLPGEISDEEATAKARHGDDHRANRIGTIFGPSTQNAPAARRRTKAGASSLLHVGTRTKQQFEQTALDPKFQMFAILRTRPEAHLCNRACWSSAILLKHVEQGLKLEWAPVGVVRHEYTLRPEDLSVCPLVPSSRLSPNFILRHLRLRSGNHASVAQAAPLLVRARTHGSSINSWYC